MAAVPNDQVVIIGAGLAGLCCARALTAGGADCTVLESTDRVGGRVGSDRVDGFILDRGFQVLLTSYDEAQRTLEMNELNLGGFYPGALIRVADRFCRLADPWRQPLAGVRSLFAPVLTVADAWRMIGLRRRAQRSPGDPEAASCSTAAYLRECGFSERSLLRFFRPFFGGVFLERELATPRSMFDFVFTAFSTGVAALPRGGMQAIPDQLVGTLPEGCVALNSPVTAMKADEVVLQSGRSIPARRVVLGTDVTAAAALHSAIPRRDWCGTTTLYFAAERPPVEEPILVLDGTGQGPVNHLCVPSQVAPGYAPAGSALISASVIGVHDLGDHDLEAAVREQMTGWFGDQVKRWRHLRTYRIAQALPRPRGATAPRPTPDQPLAEGLYACGDYMENSSINGAMLAGRRTGEAILADLDRRVAASRGLA